MSSLPNDSDSAQMGYLRNSFRRAFPHQRATAYRLGRYAAGLPIKQVDYGAHSARWITQFTKGLGKL